MSKPPPSVVILGAGPVGLEALALLHAWRLPVRLLEAGPVAAGVAGWTHVRMFTPFGPSSSAWGRDLLWRNAPNRSGPALTEHLTGREFRDDYLLPLAQLPPLAERIYLDSRVIAVGRDRPGPFRLLVRDGKGAERLERADMVVDCTGLARPNWLGAGGLPALGELAARPAIPHRAEDVLGARRAHYANKTVAVVGGGTSAAAVVIDLVKLAEEEQGTWVVWLNRDPRPAPLTRIAADPLKERDRLAARANHLAARCEGNLEYHAGVQLDEVAALGPDQGFRLVGRAHGEPMTWAADRVIAAAGHRADRGLTDALDVAEGEGWETGEPGYYVLGSKAAGGAPFLLADGLEQVRQLAARLARDWPAVRPAA